MTIRLDDPLEPNTIRASPTPARGAQPPPVAARSEQPAPPAPPVGTQTGPAPGQAVVVLDKIKATGLALCALVMIGCVAPWATFGPISRGGMDGDGPIFLAGAVLAAVLVATARLRVLVPILGVLLAAGGALDASDVASTGDGGLGLSIGWGLYAVIAGGVGLAIWAVVNRGATPRA